MKRRNFLGLAAAIPFVPSLLETPANYVKQESRDPCYDVYGIVEEPTDYNKWHPKTNSYCRFVDFPGSIRLFLSEKHQEGLGSVTIYEWEALISKENWEHAENFIRAVSCVNQRYSCNILKHFVSQDAKDDVYDKYGMVKKRHFPYNEEVVFKLAAVTKCRTWNEEENYPEVLREKIGFSRDHIVWGRESYKEDYRFVALRGPLVCNTWGYDLEGKPMS